MLGIDLTLLNKLILEDVCRMLSVWPQCMLLGKLYILHARDVKLKSSWKDLYF